MEPPHVTSGPVVAENNIINRRGGESLYQVCSKLKGRLARVPGFDKYINQMSVNEEEHGTNLVLAMRDILRTGHPLLHIYNANQPTQNIWIDEEPTTPSNEKSKVNKHKRAALEFLKACVNEMHINPDDCIHVTELYKDNMQSFVKVVKLLNRVLDILEANGHLYPAEEESSTPARDPSVPLTRREHILRELRNTDRDYVLHLENLLALRVELQDELQGDVIHQIFSNLADLLDFTQRFLIGIESQYEQPEEKQNWGKLFLAYRDGFSQYVWFIANQHTSDAVCLREWERIHSAPIHEDLQQMVAQSTTLNGFLVKPFQRLTKYPLILGELLKLSQDQTIREDLEAAIDMIQERLDEANHAVEKDKLEETSTDLANRLENWNALKPESFGRLVRYGAFSVIKGEGGKDADREYDIYLFETIILCCKEAVTGKQKAKLMGKDRAMSMKSRGRFTLKGRIYLLNVTTVQKIIKPGNIFRLQLSWKSEPAGKFTIKFANEHYMNEWHDDLKRLLGSLSNTDTRFSGHQSMTSHPPMSPGVDIPAPPPLPHSQSFSSVSMHQPHPPVSPDAESPQQHTQPVFFPSAGPSHSQPLSYPPAVPHHNFHPHSSQPLPFPSMPGHRSQPPSHSSSSSKHHPRPPIPSTFENPLAPAVPSTNQNPSSPSLDIPPVPTPSSHDTSSSLTMPLPPLMDPPSPLDTTSDSETFTRTSTNNSRPGSDAALHGSIKAKVNFEERFVTLVLPLNIPFQSLTDRIDAKLRRLTDRSLSKNTARLRYKDEDGDMITIDGDEAVQLAFLEWRDQRRNSLASGDLGEIQLFCQAL